MAKTDQTSNNPNAGLFSGAQERVGAIVDPKNEFVDPRIPEGLTKRPGMLNRTNVRGMPIGPMNNRGHAGGLFGHPGLQGEANKIGANK